MNGHTALPPRRNRPAPSAAKKSAPPSENGTSPTTVNDNGNASKPASPSHTPGEAVKKLRLSKALTIPEGTMVYDACRRMAARRVDAVLLTDGNGLLAGIATDKDVATRVIAEGLSPEQTNISKIMTRNPVFVMADTMAMEALRKMVQEAVDTLLADTNELGGSTVVVDRATPKEEDKYPSRASQGGFGAYNPHGGYGAYNAYISAATRYAALVALADPKLGAEGCKNLFDWLSKHLSKISDSSEALHLLKPTASALTDKSVEVRKGAEASIGEILRVYGHEAVTQSLKNLRGPALTLVSNTVETMHRVCLVQILCTKVSNDCRICNNRAFAWHQMLEVGLHHLTT